MNIVETHGLCKRYGKAMRVKHLDLTVPEGAVYGFLGPNGAGKSTTLKMILGLAKPTAGTVSVFGKPMEPHNRIQLLRQIGAYPARAADAADGVDHQYLHLSTSLLACPSASSSSLSNFPITIPFEKCAS